MVNLNTLMKIIAVCGLLMRFTSIALHPTYSHKYWYMVQYNLFVSVPIVYTCICILHPILSLFMYPILLYRISQCWCGRILLIVPWLSPSKVMTMLRNSGKSKRNRDKCWPCSRYLHRRNVSGKEYVTEHTCVETNLMLIRLLAHIKHYVSYVLLSS